MRMRPVPSIGLIRKMRDYPRLPYGLEPLQQNAYFLARSSLYDRALLFFPRPFPLDAVAFDVFKTSKWTKGGQAVLTLSFRTIMGRNLMRSILNDVHWDKKSCSLGAEGCVWFIDFNKETIIDVFLLFNAIFTRLIKATDSHNMQITLLKTLQVLETVLNVFCCYYLRGFPGDNYYLSARYYPQDLLGIKETGLYAKDLHENLTNTNVEGLFQLLKIGGDANARYNYQTLLNALIVEVIPAFDKHKYSDKNEVLSSVLSLLKLLLEFGARPTEIAFRRTAFEALLDISHQFRDKIPVEFFATMLQLLSAADAVSPHIFISEEDKNYTLGLILDGSNYFLKNLSEFNQNKPKIIDCIRKDDSLCFMASNGVVIRAKTVHIDKLKPEERESLYHYKALHTLFSRHFPWQKYFKKEEEHFSYFQNLLRKNTKAIDLLYIEDRLVGVNIIDLRLIEDDKLYLVHFIKLAMADLSLRDYQRFMSMISFARGFALESRVPTLTYYEVASVDSYLQTAHLETAIRVKKLQDLIVKIVANLYQENTLFSEGLSYQPDPLAIEKKSAAPLLFWNKNPEKKQSIPKKIDTSNLNQFFLRFAHLAQQGFEDRYFKAGFCLLIAFFNNSHNHEQLAKKINPHCAPGLFNKVIDLYKEIGPNPTMAKF